MPNKGMNQNMMNMYPPSYMQDMSYFAIQQQAQFQFLNTLLNYKLSIGLYQLMPQIEQVIDKSKHLEYFKQAEQYNRSGNPTESANILFQILREGESEQAQELMEEIDRIQKENLYMETPQLQTLLGQYGMTPLDIQQLTMIHQQNVQMQMMSMQQQQNQMMTQEYPDIH